MSEEYWTSDEIDVGHFIGPALNATNVPLDTVIFVGLMRASTVGHPELSPQVYVSHREEQSGFPAWLDVTFYFSEPLKSVQITMCH